MHSGWGSVVVVAAADASWEELREHAEAWAPEVWLLEEDGREPQGVGERGRRKGPNTRRRRRIAAAAAEGDGQAAWGAAVAAADDASWRAAGPLLKEEGWQGGRPPRPPLPGVGNRPRASRPPCCRPLPPSGFHPPRQPDGVQARWESPPPAPLVDQRRGGRRHLLAWLLAQSPPRSRRRRRRAAPLP